MIDNDSLNDKLRGLEKRYLDVQRKQNHLDMMLENGFLLQVEGDLKQLELDI